MQPDRGLCSVDGMKGKGSERQEKVGSKYDAYYYWENLIHQEAPLWQNGFQDSPLTEESLFVYTVLMDHQKDFLKNRWAYYPDVYALLGFLQYVFLPTAFFTWLDEEAEGFNIPLATGEQLLHILCQLEADLDFDQVNLMRAQLTELKACWELAPAECLGALRRFAEAFNQAWRGKTDKLIYFQVFQDPTEIGNYVAGGGEMGEEVFAEVLEEELEMSLDQWQEICENVYRDGFMRKKFIHLLNYKINCMI